MMDHNPASVNTPENVQDHELVVGADFDKPIYYRQILIRSLVVRVFLDQVDTVRRFPALIRSVVRVQRVIPIQNLPLRRLSLRLRLRWRAADIFDAQSTLCVLKIPKMFRR